MDVTQPVELVKGVGPKTAEKLVSAGIATVEDLVFFFPRRFEDYSKVSTIGELEPGRVTLKATVSNVSSRRVRRGLSIVEATLTDKTGSVRAVWFNQPYRAAQLEGSHEYYVSGDYGLQRGRYIILNPSVEKLSDLPVQTGRVLPVYREVRGIRSHQFRKILSSLRPLMSMWPETLPQELVKREKLVSASDALLGMHFPSSFEDIEKAEKRLAFEELFVLQLASVMNKRDNAATPSWKIPFNESAAKAFVRKLPFTLTDAQRVSAWEIVQNFESATPMNRLLQGDVGAGKTVVAGMAAFLAAQAGYQTAIMAPTEILATQHAATLDALLKPFSIEIALLIGSVKPAQKRQLKEAIADGSVDIVVGTHALIQEDVVFHKLGFVVIDEQHRFGVRQRQELLKKSKYMPHLLSMTATPIPRSLALTVYGELDISVLNQRPAGRKPIKTSIHSPNSRAQLYTQIAEELSIGRQAYVVCPAITDLGELNEVKSVETEYKRLRSGPLKQFKIAMLHGKLKAEEKEAIMRDFVAGITDILVTTTVIEVGVDVPNATVMLIESADRFGLAQLHQLRGRVGRSSHQSYCFLVPSTSQQPSQRLREMERSDDGFYLAEVDLAMRGPGEIYGRAQHGALDLSVAKLGDTRMILLARKAAEWFVEEKDLLQYQQLASKVDVYRRLTTLN